MARRFRNAAWAAVALGVLALYLWAPFPATWIETALLLAAVAAAAAADALSR